MLKITPRFFRHASWTSFDENVPCQWQVKDFEELTQGCLVHGIDHAHLCDEEVKDAASGGNRTIFCLSFFNFFLCFCCNTELCTDFSSSFLSYTQNADHRVIIHQGTFNKTHINGFSLLEMYKNMTDSSLKKPALTYNRNVCTFCTAEFVQQVVLQFLHFSLIGSYILNKL